jgi:hypothetical protein
MYNDKQYMLLISNDSKAAVLPFPPKLDLPEKKVAKDIPFFKTERTKTFPTYKATIYVQNPCTLDLDNYADPIEAEAPQPIVSEFVKETTIYGASDDLIEFDGGYTGEVGCYGTGDREQGVLIIVSDGTMLEVKYGKNDMAIWGINVINKGAAFKSIETCEDEDAPIYSDVVTLQGDIKYIYAVTDGWEKVQ